MSTDPTKKKRRVMHSLTINEISLVDRPACEGCSSLLMKRAEPIAKCEPFAKVVPPSQPVPPTPSPQPAPSARATDRQSDMNPESILKNAQQFRAGAEQPKYIKDDYDDAVLALAKAERRPTESVERALVRLCDENDPRLAALSEAAMFAPKVARQQSAAPMAKSSKDVAWDTMEKRARDARLPTETAAQAMTRLLSDGDAEMADAAEQYYGRSR